MFPCRTDGKVKSSGVARNYCRCCDSYRKRSTSARDIGDEEEEEEVGTQ